MPGATLLLCAHHDDEFFVLPWLKREAAAGTRILAAFLTYGSIYGADAEVRATESRGVLQSLGVKPDDLLLVGRDADVFDGELPAKAEPALRALHAVLGDCKIERILVPAWEGGHPDHDAGQVVGAALARRLGSKLYEYPAYNGRGLPWHFGRVMEFPDAGGDAQVMRLGFKEGWWAVRCGFAYRSQWRSFRWILPGAINKYLLARRLLLRPVPANRDYRLAPHRGQLLYERRTPFRFTQFRETLRPFLQAHLTGPSV